MIVLVVMLALALIFSNAAVIILLVVRSIQDRLDALDEQRLHRTQESQDRLRRWVDRG